MISWSVCEVLLLAGCGVTSDISSTGTTSSLQQESQNGELGPIMKVKSLVRMTF